jgi:hypothetical protein
MSGLWTRYNKLLDTQPLFTKALTSLTGFTLGDILAQNFVEKSGDYDIMRTLRLGSFGFLIHGTTGHYFYGFLDSKLPGTAMTTVASKVAIDQLFWNPIFGLMFFGYLNFVEGKSFEDLGLSGSRPTLSISRLSRQRSACFTLIRSKLATMCSCPFWETRKSKKCRRRNKLPITDITAAMQITRKNHWY